MTNTQTYEEKVQALEAEGLCRSDAQAVVDAQEQKRIRANANRQARNEAYRSMGLKRVRGALGGAGRKRLSEIQTLRWARKNSSAAQQNGASGDSLDEFQTMQQILKLWISLSEREQNYIRQRIAT